jgi:hypothetical protein
LFCGLWLVMRRDFWCFETHGWCGPCPVPTYLLSRGLWLALPPACTKIPVSCGLWLAPPPSPAPRYLLFWGLWFVLLQSCVVMLVVSWHVICTALVPLPRCLLSRGMWLPLLQSCTKDTCVSWPVIGRASSQYYHVADLSQVIHAIFYRLLSVYYIVFFVLSLIFIRLHLYSRCI